MALSTGLWDVVSDQEACDFTTRVCSRGGSAVLAAEKVRPTRNLLRRFCVCFDGFRFSYYGGGYRLNVCVALQLRDEALERNSRDNISVMVPTPATSLFAFSPTFLFSTKWKQRSRNPMGT